MKTTWSFFTGIALTLMMAVSVHAQTGAGIRIWAADYDIDGSNAGDGAFALGYVEIEDAIGTLILEAGYGSVDLPSGDLSRSEFALGFTSTEDMVFYGAAFRAMFLEQDELDVNLLGPELTLGVEIPISDGSVFPYLGGTLGWYYVDGSNAIGDVEGSILGYSLDGGLGIELSDVTFKLGFRLQSLGDDGEDVPEQDFTGPYVEISFDW